MDNVKHGKGNHYIHSLHHNLFQDTHCYQGQECIFFVLILFQDHHKSNYNLTTHSNKPKMKMELHWHSNMDLNEKYYGSSFQRNMFSSILNTWFQANAVNTSKHQTRFRFFEIFIQFILQKAILCTFLPSKSFASFSLSAIIPTNQGIFSDMISDIIVWIINVQNKCWIFRTIEATSFFLCSISTVSCKAFSVSYLIMSSIVK